MSVSSNMGQKSWLSQTRFKDESNLLNTEDEIQKKCTAVRKEESDMYSKPFFVYQMLDTESGESGKSDKYRYMFHFQSNKRLNKDLKNAQAH